MSFNLFFEVGTLDFSGLSLEEDEEEEEEREDSGNGGSGHAALVFAVDTAATCDGRLCRRG